LISLKLLGMLSSKRDPLALNWAFAPLKASSNILYFLYIFFLTASPAEDFLKAYH
jgi:hypothetical protein